MLENRRMAIFAHSGTYDRLHQLLSIVMAGVSNGMEVHIFFSFWALQSLKVGEIDTIRLEDPYKQFERNFRERMAEGRISSVSTMLETTKSMGNVKVYACSASMAILGIERSDLVDGVDEVMGLVTFLAIAEEAKITLYV